MFNTATTVQSIRPWLPEWIDELKENPASSDDIVGTFRYHGDYPDASAWEPNEHGPAVYLYDYFSAEINEKASIRETQPKFHSLSVFSETIAQFRPYLSLEELRQAIWMFYSEAKNKNSRLEYLQTLKEAGMSLPIWDRRDFLYPPAVSEYSEKQRAEYLAERNFLSESMQHEWQTPEFLIDAAHLWHVPHHDTAARRWIDYEICGLHPRLAGLSMDGRDISGKVMDINLSYYYPSGNLIKDLKDPSGILDSPIGVQTAPYGWHVLRLAFFAKTVPEISSSPLVDKEKGTVFDISATLTDFQDMVSVSGRGIWEGHRLTHRAGDMKYKDEFAVLLPANEDTLNILGMPAPEEELCEQAEAEAMERIVELRNTNL